MIRKDNVLEVEHLGGGKGTAYIHHIVSKEELLGHGRLYAKVVLPPGASVGWHQHVHDTEPYYILKGEADFIDNDKSVILSHFNNTAVTRANLSHRLVIINKICFTL